MSFSALARPRPIAWLLLLSVFMLNSCFAVSANAITKGYLTDDDKLVPGMVVSLSPDSSGNTSKVQRATQGESKIIGIAANPSESFVTLASGKAQAYIESEGEVDAYVSDINGSVKKGDLLTLSPLRGILMRIDDSSTAAMAVAAEDFTASQAEEYNITDSDKKTVLIDKLRVNLDYKGDAQSTVNNESSLQRLARNIVGKDVGPLRPIIALIIFFLIMVTEGSILYGSISSAVTSLGRNPLARGVILKELMKIFAMVALVLMVGIATIYGVLWI